MKFAFNRSELIKGNSIESPMALEIENTPTLRQASLDMAIRYGGSLTRRALSAMEFTNTKKNIVVDTKVHYLMKDWSPSIPGWHTDGVPRGKELNPAGKDEPYILSQETSGISRTVYHLMVCGDVSLTKFIQERNILLDVPDTPSRELYAMLTRQINERVAKGNLHEIRAEANRVYTWDFWETHSAEWAIGTGWRFLIRVTETDYIKPRTELNDIFRFQNMVYVKSDEVGW